MVILLAGMFVAGALNHHVLTHAHHPVRIWVSRLINKVGNPVRWAAASWRAKPLELILDIKHKHFEKLIKKRSEALALGKLLASPDDYVPGTISADHESVRVKLRLKGDWNDHLAGNKWSYRIKVKGDATFLGMKRFSLQHPATRNYAGEWLFHQALKREGVIGLRYEFVNLTVNGQDLGVYALEEHFEKRLIEHNRRREGPIVRFNEDLFWGGYGSDVYYASEVDAFNMDRALADDTLRPMVMKAVSLLTAFRRRDLEVSDVFDIDLLARYYALSDLFGAEHNINYHNLRFYYNPITSRLEPIGFDAQAARLLRRILEESETADQRSIHDFGRRLFADKAFVSTYHRELMRISQRDYLKQLIADVKQDLNRNLDILHSEFPGAVFSTEYLDTNQEKIRSTLNPPKAIQAWMEDVEADGVSDIVLRVANICGLTVEVVGIAWNDTNLVDLESPIILQRKLPSRPMDFLEVRLPLHTSAAPSNGTPTVRFRILGLEKVMRAEIFPWVPRVSETLRADILRRPPNVQQFDFVHVNERERIIDIMPGNWHIDRDMVFPSGFHVRMRPGTTLDLAKDVKIISRSALMWHGEKERPIVVRSTSGFGQGLAVISAKTPSILEHVIFENLSNPRDNDWALTGAVTFYDSPALLQDCMFIQNRSEDALNIIRGTFQLDNCRFYRTQSDALDADFANGKVSSSEFVEVGNDAIDVSGSTLQIDQVRILAAGDKGLSAGEKSHLRVSRVEISDTEIAVASKDLSEIELTQSKIQHSKIGLVAYQKKPEFGPADILAHALTLDDIERPLLLEQGSRIVIEGHNVPPAMQKVERILYGVEYGKKSH